MSRRPKPAGEKAIRRNLTFHPRIWEMAEKQAAALGFSSVSSYLAHLLRLDAAAESLDPKRGHPSPPNPSPAHHIHIPPRKGN